MADAFLHGNDVITQPFFHVCSLAPEHPLRFELVLKGKASSQKTINPSPACVKSCENNFPGYQQKYSYCISTFDSHYLPTCRLYFWVKLVCLGPPERLVTSSNLQWDLVYQVHVVLNQQKLSSMDHLSQMYHHLLRWTFVTNVRVN